MAQPRIDFSQATPPSSIIIENVEPILDCGRYPVKREVGDLLEVSADIFKDGHDKLAAWLLIRRAQDETWRRIPMRLVENDRWTASAPLLENTRYLYTIFAVPDRFATWREELSKKFAAGLDVALELREGLPLLEASAATTDPPDPEFARVRAAVESAKDQQSAVDLMLSPAVEALMAEHLPVDGGTRLATELEVTVDRVQARYATWYELFPRSAGTVEGRSGTFDDVIARMPAIQQMGFDVLYFPPIHPIGKVNRKGPNNTLHAGPADPGVPYAIGSDTGGHDAIEPALGTLDDFERLVAAARAHGIEIALDFAIQAAPDHPWASTHREWFHIRPDGTIKYAENPPKRYEDIYPINFNSEAWAGLWHEMHRILEIWIERGVKIFRVDNPHTKPTIFWEWLIAGIQRDHPEVIFLSEAFTRPKVMKALAKAGFTQSYSYFTWRNYKQEIIDYFTELTQTNVKEYMRANLFPVTPDILPVILQQGGRPAFKLRLLLAATLSSVYGMYSGFELCENTPVPGKEEYLNSEKYDFKVWDWDRPGNIIDYVTSINRIRREHTALHEYDNLRFYWADDDNMICYGKPAPNGAGGVLVVANLDPLVTHQGMFHFLPEDFGVPAGQDFRVTELITGQRFTWNGGSHHLYLDPAWEPGLIYAIHPSQHVDYIDPSG